MHLAKGWIGEPTRQAFRTNIQMPLFHVLAERHWILVTRRWKFSCGPFSSKALADVNMGMSRPYFITGAERYSPRPPKSKTPLS